MSKKWLRQASEKGLKFNWTAYRLRSHDDASLGDLLALLQLGVRVAHLELRALPQLKALRPLEGLLNGEGTCGNMDFFSRAWAMVTTGSLPSFAYVTCRPQASQPIDKRGSGSGFQQSHFHSPP